MQRSICVYCGSRDGADPVFVEQAEGLDGPELRRGRKSLQRASWAEGAPTSTLSTNRS